MTTLKRAASVVLVVAVAALAAGCLGVTPPLAPSVWAPALPTARRAIDWPERWGDDRAGKGVLLPVADDPAARRGRRYGEHHHGRPLPEDFAHAAGLAAGRVGAAGYRFRVEGPGGYVISAPVEAPPLAVAPGAPARPPWRFEVFVSGRADDASASPSSPESVRLQRTWMVRRAPADRAPRGLVVVVPGLYGAPRPLFEGLADALVEDGWAVLRLLAPSSRFMETVEVFLDPDDGPASARRFSDITDDRLAETAYAIEAGVAAFTRERPELAALPRVIIGISGGAIAAPAAAARLTEASGRGFDAVVLIAGGENMLRISGESAYTEAIDSVRFRWPGWNKHRTLPPPEVLAPAADAYLEAAALDPGNLAWAVEHANVLMVHGRRDRAVPAASGDALWLRLGRPERWEAAAGHLELIFRLWLKKQNLLRWLDNHAQIAETEGQAPAASAGGGER